MIDNRISAVPIVDDGKLVGIVTENDLLRRVELKTGRQRPRWLHFFTSDATLLAEYVRSHGQTAGDVMTPDVLTVSPDTPIAEIADIFESRHIKRMPVVGQEKIVGIVSRANLMQALAVQPSVPVTRAETSDNEIRDALFDEIANIGWAPMPIVNNVTATDGVIHLWGLRGQRGRAQGHSHSGTWNSGMHDVKDHRTDTLFRPYPTN